MNKANDFTEDRGGQEINMIPVKRYVAFLLIALGLFFYQDHP